MNDGILIPLGPGIPPGDVKGFCGFNCGFLSAVPGRMLVAAAAAVTVDVSFVLSSDCFWSLQYQHIRVAYIVTVYIYN